MSFVPAPQQANAAIANKNATSHVVTTQTPALEAESSDLDTLFKMRTFDVFWVDKKALMYKDGYQKVREKIRLYLT